MYAWVFNLVHSICNCSQYLQKASISFLFYSFFTWFQMNGCKCTNLYNLFKNILKPQLFSLSLFNSCCTFILNTFFVLAHCNFAPFSIVVALFYDCLALCDVFFFIYFFKYADNSHVRVHKVFTSSEDCFWLNRGFCDHRAFWNFINIWLLL